MPTGNWEGGVANQEQIKPKFFSGEFHIKPAIFIANLHWRRKLLLLPPPRVHGVIFQKQVNYYSDCNVEEIFLKVTNYLCPLSRAYQYFRFFWPNSHAIYYKSLWMIQDSL